MVKAKARRPGAPLGGWRHALAYVLLAAFALQSYVVQTHIHLAPADAAKLFVSGPAHGGHDRYPAGDDPANCPLCQEILHSGHYVTPAALAYAPPTLAVSTVLLVDAALPFIVALSHSWHGRAPPQA